MALEDRPIAGGPLQPVYVANQVETAGGGGGTPADPSEENLIQVGGAAIDLGRESEVASIPVALDDESYNYIQTMSAYQASIATATGTDVDVAVTTDADGTISGKLRGLVAILADVWSDTLNSLRVSGNAAHDATDADNPVAIGGYAADSPPADVSTVGDRVKAWFRRNGALAVYHAYGLNITDDILRALAPGVVIRPTITTSGAGYVSNDVVGGIITLSGVMEAAGRQAKLTTLVIKDKDNGAPALNIYFFRATPSGGTYTDNGGLAWGTGDLGNCVGTVQVLAGDYLQDGTSPQAVATIAGLDMLMGSATSDLYCLIINKSSVTLTNGNFSAEFAFERM